jgi:hypothetical protein
MSTFQSGTFRRLPSKEEIVKLVDEERRHLNDLAAYMLYIVPVAERFGDGVYAVAAQALNQAGVSANAEELRAIAAELRTPEGRLRYAESRRLHVEGHVCG